MKLGMVHVGWASGPGRNYTGFENLQIPIGKQQQLESRTNQTGDPTLSATREAIWTASALWIAAGMPTGQVLPMVGDLGGDVVYDAATQILRVRFGVTAATAEAADHAARLHVARSSSSRPAVSVRVRPGDPRAVEQCAPLEVQELTSGMRGCWVVVTQGSLHLWDLDSLTYTRIPGAASPSGAFSFDAQPMAITRIERWPRIGSTSLVWYDDPADPGGREHWRQSSRIVSISEI
jgi:hypothetical protein